MVMEIRSGPEHQYINEVFVADKLSALWDDGQIHPPPTKFSYEHIPMNILLVWIIDLIQFDLSHVWLKTERKNSRLQLEKMVRDECGKGWGMV